ncbi:carboxypeptidase-like regulatory domain-containing protein [Prevotella sp. oral taxon 475]|nr:carboxypeptidase-like regulatory domain-containing protein [Prevotella sp. oral taxon 475]
MIRFLLTTLISILMLPVAAQDFSTAPPQAVITGVVTNAITGDTLSLPSIAYKGHGIAVSGNTQGYFRIPRREGWTLTISAVGYQPKTIAVKSGTPSVLNIRLRPDTRQIAEVVVREKRSRYSRKNNPAVELMKRVIAAKKRTRLDNHDFYQYTKYQKLTLALNDLTPAQLDSGFIGKRRWMLDHVEVCPYNDKLILPVSVDETVTQHLYRKNPRSEKNIITGQSSTGINQLIETGDMLNTLLKDVFTDIDIYDDQVRLLQHTITSPIGNGAISFYRYYIEDTVLVDRDLCYHLQFLPNNQQDFGFRGELYILADSSLHVKRCHLTIPTRSNVNFIENLQVQQAYTRLPNGEWALSTDDMVVELKVNKLFSKCIVIRTTRLDDYTFEPLPARLFKGRAKERHEADALMRNEDFWKRYRAVELTKSESSMDEFVRRIQQIKGFKYILFGAKALIENFVETGSKEHPSRVDIGPINTMITQNFIDGLRTRLSAQTTAHLNKHWFASGYIARGWGSKKNYYRAEAIYSFNKKEYLPREFPRRTLSFSSTYDVMSPSDKFMRTDKDNVFTALKWTKVDKMMFYNRQQLTFEREEDWGLKTILSLKTEENEAAGALFFEPLSYPVAPFIAPGTDVGCLLHNGKIRTTEVHLEVELAPGRTYINTKQRRLPINLDAPVFTLSHTLGIKGFLGGDYRYNLTEVGLYKRFWMSSWGKIDVRLNAGAQWNRVPFLLLIMPAANLSYIKQKGTFSLMNNMEFLNDRYASFDLSWDMNGKIFNRVPLLRKLKWREFIGVKGLWGTLTSKNNPTLAENAGSTLLMYFPEGTYVMNPRRPYLEAVAGVHNIFKVFHVEYVHRINYNHLPTAHKHGVRIMFRMTF